MEKIIISHLKIRKNKEIPLTEIERLFAGNTNYNDFAKAVKSLEEDGILIPVKSHKTNNKPNPLYNTYRINKSYFKEGFINQIQSFKFKADESINLQDYFTLNEQEWEKDFLYIQAVDNYIKEKGLPDKEASSPERSYQIIGDEKWIDEKGGRALLERLHLWDKFKITYNVDPLMLAINPRSIDDPINKHIIVENKATFYDLLSTLKNTSFTSLVYGAGWKIVSNILMLEKQLGLEDRGHKIYYFGDLDYEGLSIWNTLNEKRPVIPAKDFYTKLLKKPASQGKRGQKENIRALENFIENFSEEEGNRIKDLLKDRYYYPQEGLNRDEIEKVWIQIDGGN